MKKILLCLALSFLFISNVSAEEHQFVQPVKEIIRLVSLDMGYDTPEVAVHIVGAESDFNPLTRDGDMNILCKRTGKPVQARGLAQITSCYHPEVSDEEAHDVEFAIRFLIQGLLDGKCKKEWSTCPTS